MIGIYRIVNLSTGKVYIGSAVSITRRWAQHKRELRKDIHGNEHLQRAWNKYGESDFNFQIIEVFEDRTQLLSREQHWIDKCIQDEKGVFNIRVTAGSNLGNKLSESTKQKISAARKGRKFSEAHKANLSIARQKRVFSEETKQKMRDAITEEHRMNRALRNKGRVVSDETKQKMSQSAKDAWARRKESN